MATQSFFTTLREASFRNIPFEVESADESGGRRLARHEYPLRDVPYAEDLGRKAGEWSVEAYIVQGRKYDYAKARDELRKALNERGPGTLIHPTLGDISVAVDSYRLKESSREGGYCTFSITFVEPGQPQNPGSREDTAHTVRKAGSSAREMVLASFQGLYIPLPQELTLLAAELEAAVSLGMAYVSLPLALVGEALAYAQSLLASPLALGGAVLGIFGQMLGSMDAGQAKEYGYAGPAFAPCILQGQNIQRSQSRELPALENLLTPNPVTHTATVFALRNLVAQAVTLEDALATAGQDFTTADDALSTRSTVLAGLDAVEPALPDALYSAVGGVRLAVARDLTTRGGLLPQVRRVVLPSTLPSVVVAYTLYGDAGREGEIVRRNRIRHPGRVPGGVELEILSR